MDIDLLSKMVRELVRSHDVVGLPGVGTFVAEEVPASFSDRGFTINPPYRRLSFHSGRSDDNLVIDLYAKSNNVDFDTAKAIICQFLSELKTVLIDSRNVVMPGLGRLRVTRENVFFFVSDPDLDIYPDGFGLAPLSLKFHESSAPALTDAMLSAAIPEKPVVSEPVAVVEEVPEDPVVAEPSPAENTSEEPVPAVSSRPSKPRRRLCWAIPLALLCLAVLALAVFLILAHTAPDFIDSILYTPEELRIINY